jgi:LPXTG-motif cell wall-anchored protein
MKNLVYVIAVLILGVGIVVAQTSGTTSTGTGGTAGTSAQTGTTSGTTGTTGTTTDQTGTSTPSADQSQAGANATDNTQNAQGNRLPQTASPLPLLGLLGLTSVGGAILSRKRKP